LEKLGEFMMMKKMLLIIALACFYQSIETTFADQKGDEQRAQVAKEEALAAAQARVANASVPLANCTGNNSQECNSARTDLAQATADLKVLSGQQASEAKRSALKGIGDEESKRVAAAACKKNRDEKKLLPKNTPQMETMKPKTEIWERPQ
jgi:multidrug resistance efflux pump